MHDYFWFSLFILINGLLLFLLTANVSRLRIKHKISLGDAGNKQMIDAIRAHGNLLEQFPIYALLLLTLTLQEANTNLLAALSISFIIARVIHAYGMLTRHFLSRRIGAALTYFLQISALVLLLISLFD